MVDWSFLTNHARVLLCIAHDPGVRLREIAARTGVTERTAYGIVTDLTEAGYVVKHKDGRRNRYQIQAHLPLPATDSRKRTIGEILALLTGADDEATITPTYGLCRSGRGVLGPAARHGRRPLGDISRGGVFVAPGDGAQPPGDCRGPGPWLPVHGRRSRCRRGGPTTGARTGPGTSQ
jgi:IclR helix-turn-helix domain